MHMTKGLLWYRKPDWFKGTLAEWQDQMLLNEIEYDNLKDSPNYKHAMKMNFRRFVRSL